MLNALRFPLCIVLLLALTIAKAGATESMAGDWHGVLSTPQGELVLIVTLIRSDDGYGGVLESPAQAPGQKIPLHDVQVSADTFEFTIPAIAANYRGTWDGERWTGTFHQQIDLPLTLERGLPPPAPVIDGMDGTWNGAVNRNGVDLRLILRVETSERGTIARLDSPDMGGVDLPVSGFEREGGIVRFEVVAAAVRYEGRLADDGEQLVGTWRRTGQDDAEVEFTRISIDTARAERERPQTPKPPFPYSAEEVRFDNPQATGVTLAGTLTLPKGDGPFPAAILITGSGPQDRDEAIFGHRPFAVLADHLSRHGIAVLRYDDRGFAASTGDHGAATSADFATDANAAARFLLDRPEIDPAAIGLIGHSEGGMIAPLAAIDHEHIAFMVMLAGPGTSTAQLIDSQRRLIGMSQGASERDLERGTPVIAQINAAILDTEDRAAAQERVRAVLTPEALQALGATHAQRELLVHQFTRDWYRYFLRYDAAAVLSRIQVPVLALNGSLDVQVPADENLAAIAAALADNPDVTISKLDGLNHMFQTASTGSFGEYTDIAETFAPSALAQISDWIGARFLVKPVD